MTRERISRERIKPESTFVALQDLAFITHHPSWPPFPYNSVLCILSGFWNEFLDNQNVLKALEMSWFLELGLGT
ncbi:B domain of TMEM189, localization domain containing protein, partial [Parasponia andersonii]